MPLDPNQWQRTDTYGMVHNMTLDSTSSMSRDVDIVVSLGFATASDLSVIVGGVALQGFD